MFLPPGNNNILNPPCNRGIPIIIHMAHIAGFQPAIIGKGFCRFFR